MIEKKRKWSDRIKIVNFPLFPGYIFTRLNYQQDYVKVLNHHGNLGFIMLEGKAASMLDEDIASLKYLVQQGQAIQSDPGRLFSPGQTVEINFGDFKGQKGIIKKVKNKNRVSIYLDLLGQTVTAEFDAIELSLVESDHNNTIEDKKNKRGKSSFRATEGKSS